MNKQEKAIEVVKELERIMKPDVKSCLKWIEEYPIGCKNIEYGGLNFTLALLSLVICEVLGYYTTDARKHKTGTYIMEFIRDYFPKKSYFKKLNKVLADYLRNILVHGFGFYNPNQSIDIGLFIHKCKNLEVEILCQDELPSQSNTRIIKLNSYALGYQTLRALDELKREIKKGNSKLCKNITDADKQAKQRPMSKKVSNQFDVVYKELKRKRSKM